MRKQIFQLFLLLILSTNLFGQEGGSSIQGRITEKNSEGTSIPLIGANVFWMGHTLGTSTDEQGIFEIKKVPNASQLVVSYIGYQNDTIDVRGEDFLNINLESSVLLDEVEITHRQRSTQISYMDPLKLEKIDEKELLKAACCNLSESFETNPSVDVSFTDAVTGTRQIQLLGLAGPYTQITRENMPNVRGLSSMYGMTYIPGTWVESIQLVKGMGSVVNGYESVAGQINVELRKPESARPLYLNIYGNEGGRIEANLNLAHRLAGDKWSTAVLLHGFRNSVRWDRNEDGFLDMPISDRFIGLNRWKYSGDNGLRLQFGIKGTFLNNTGGQVDFEDVEDPGSFGLWGMKLNTKRIDGWAKIGKVYEDTPWKSIGLQLSGSTHDQESYFGNNRYDAVQNSFYGNLVFQSIINNTNHTFKTGASILYDDYDELLNENSFDRKEVIPGAYFEYVYNHFEKFNLVAGIRVDHHNIFGAFVTPRLHLRYALTDWSVLRSSFGRGQRTAVIIAENNGLLASSRQIIIEDDGSDKPYGLDPEVAWNFGLNLTQYFTLDYREGTFSLDFYRTNFDNQIVIDLDRSPQQAVFYNLEGRSFSNSFQAQVDYELTNRLDARIAYRWFDVQTTYDGELIQKPLVSTHRAFLNLAYETRDSWKFDYTLNWQGSKRIPFTGSNPVEYQLDTRSPSFTVMNAQISKTWNESFEVYLGVENILNYRQSDPILSNEQPFGEYFDSSLVWGPIFGRNTYFGIRYRIF